MLKLTALFCLSFCLVVSFTNASLINTCNEPPAQFPFDLSQFAGRWFLIAATSNSSIADCAQASFLYVPPVNNNKGMLLETIKYLNGSSQIASSLANLTVEKMFGSANSGNIAISMPQTNWFLRLFGSNYITKKGKVVITDYSNYAIFYRCNDDNLFYAYDDYMIVGRAGASATNILNGIGSSGAINVTSLIKANQTNPICSTVTF